MQAGTGLGCLERTVPHQPATQVRARRAAFHILQRSQASQQTYENNRSARGTSLELLEVDVKEKEEDKET